jgi:hypothetical protein
LPLEARWYTEPVEIRPTEKTPHPVQAQQGDIFVRVPAVVLDSRPLLIVRAPAVTPPRHVKDWLDNAKADASAELLGVLPEDPHETAGPSKWDFEWETHGERVILHSYRAMGVLLSHDCELDKPRDKVLVTFARIRSAKGLSAEAVQIMRNRNKYRAFYLAPQADQPSIPESYIDFGALTTVSLASLPMKGDSGHFLDRYASMDPVIRDAMREDFIDFMTAERDPE